MTTKRRCRTEAPDPTVPDLVEAPELAAVFILERALDVVLHALLAEHPTLVDDHRRPGDHGRVVNLANTICLRVAALRDTLISYRRAVHHATAPKRDDNVGDDLPF